MLRYPFEEKRLRKWDSPVIVQPKLDGNRCRALVSPEGKDRLLSSEEHEITSVPHIIEDLERIVSTEPGYRGQELDGELYCHGLPLSEVRARVGRTKHLHDEHEQIQFHVFDLVDNRIQLERTNDLLWFKESKFVKVVYSTIACNLEEIMSYLNSFTSDGYEGIIVRKIDGRYKRSRSTEIMKFKPCREDAYEIVGFKEEVNKNGVPKGTLGAFVCRGLDGTTFSVGSGLTKSDRASLWRQREKLIGLYVVVKYQHLTSKNGVPRSGVFKALVERPENIGDDLF